MYEHLRDIEEMLHVTRSLVKEIALTKKSREFRSRSGAMTTSYSVDLDHPQVEILKNNFLFLYQEKGVGFKLLSSMLGNVSYTQLRTIFRKLGIESRKGKSCTTEGLRKIRSERARTSNPWRDWTGNAGLSQMHKTTKRYLGGWYYSERQKAQFWLRSSWEYAFADYLENTQVAWGVESRSYLLSDGRYYRPDFFLYKNERLVEVIEIKSTWSNGSAERIDKFEQFCKEYPEIKARLIGKELFTLVEKTPAQVLLEWKKIRTTEKRNA